MCFSVQSEEFDMHLEAYTRNFPFFFKTHYPQHDRHTVACKRDLKQCISNFFNNAVIDDVEPLNEIKLVIHGHGKKPAKGQQCASLAFQEGPHFELNELFDWIHQLFENAQEKSPALKFCTVLFTGCHGMAHEKIKTDGFKTKAFEGIDGKVEYIFDIHSYLEDEIRDISAIRNPIFDYIEYRKSLKSLPRRSAGMRISDQAQLAVGGRYKSPPSDLAVMGDAENLNQ